MAGASQGRREPGPGRQAGGAGAPQGRREPGRKNSRAYQRNANSRSDKPGPWPGLLQGQTCMQIPHP